VTGLPETQQRVLADPIGLIVEVVGEAGAGLPDECVREIADLVAGGRAKSRRLAAALAERPAVLRDGRCPAPRAVWALLLALRAAGAEVAAPACAGCGKALRSLQRRGQDWYCGPCIHAPRPCSSCGTARIVKSLDRQGLPRCAQCPETDARDPVAVIIDLVRALDPAADAQMVAAAVRAAAPQRSYQYKLAWAIEAGPTLLTGQGHRAPVRAVLPLVYALADAGIAGVERPRCPRCQRTVRLDKPLDGQRVCRNCIARSRAEPCSRCGARREPATRDHEGRPICPNCLTNDPANLEPCIGCGELRSVSSRTERGPRCPACAPPPPVRTCSICAREVRCEISKATGQPWCTACQKRCSRCVKCGQIRPIRSGTLQAPVCTECTDSGHLEVKRCRGCGQGGRLVDRACARCTLRERLNALFSNGDGVIAPVLKPLYDTLAAAPRPTTAAAWISRETVAELLGDLGLGRRELSHAVLDEMAPNKQVEHLRSILVATGALSNRDEHMIRLERAVRRLVESRQEPAERELLNRYVTWHLLRRLRTRNHGRETTHAQTTGTRQHVRAAITFLDFLNARGHTLPECTQADLDTWLSSSEVQHRITAGHFVRWALKHKIVRGVTFNAVRWTGPTGPLDDQARWECARRLITDETLRDDDRFAGLLLLLYAQWPGTISRLRREHIDAAGTEVRIRLGSSPIALPEPLATLATRLVATRRGHAALAANDANPWLFPGGQPGRPISADRMRNRLRALGIDLTSSRNTALLQLATELPAAILARTLGIHIDVAVEWQRHAAGDWAAYAADFSTRKPVMTSTSIGGDA
jgi:hypothetical protein